MPCDKPEPGEPIWNIVATTQPFAKTTDSKLDDLDIGIFSSLDVAQDKANMISSQLDIVESLAETVALDFSGIFTAINELFEKLCTIESKTEKLDDATFALEGCFGIAIRNSDIGTTGLTLSEPGEYFLDEHINYAPSGTGTAAIVLDSDNIALNLNGRTIRQTNSMGSTVGIRVTSDNNNVQIINGTVEDTTAQAILVKSDNSCVAMINVNTKLNGSEAGIEFESGCSGINLDFVTTISSDNNGLFFDSCTDIHISNVLSAGNGIPAEGAGVRFLSCDRVQVTDSVFNDNTRIGVDIFTPMATTASQYELRNLTVLDNGLVGFSLDRVEDSLITNCYVVGQSTAGARLTDCHRIKLIENMFDNNTTYNILLRGGTDNCYIFANCLMLADTNLREDSATGPNSILGNFALGAAFSDNYDIMGTTTVNLDTFDQAGTFPSPAPVSWKNMSVRT